MALENKGPGGVKNSYGVRTASTEALANSAIPKNTYNEYGGGLAVTATEQAGVVQLQVGGVKSFIGTAFNRWCIPGKDTSGTLFKDVSGRGNDATINASNTTPFAVDGRMSTVAHASAGGISVPAAAGAMDLRTDSCIMSVSMLRANPAANETVISWGADLSSSGFPGFYFSHRVSGFGRVVASRGDTSIGAGADSTIAFSNAGGTRDTSIVIAYDAPTRSFYLYRDGVLAVASVGLMAGAGEFTAFSVAAGPRIGGQATGTTYAGSWRGWQGYVFSGRGLPLNIGRISALLAESPSTPLRDDEFTFSG